MNNGNCNVELLMVSGLEEIQMFSERVSEFKYVRIKASFIVIVS